MKFQAGVESGPRRHTVGRRIRKGQMIVLAFDCRRRSDNCGYCEFDILKQFFAQQLFRKRFSHWQCLADLLSCFGRGAYDAPATTHRISKVNDSRPKRLGERDGVVVGNDNDWITCRRRCSDEHARSRHAEFFCSAAVNPSLAD